MYALLLSAMLSMLAPTGPVKWSFAAKPVETGVVAIELIAHVEHGWHIYATRLENDLGPLPTAVRFSPADGLIPLGALTEPEPEEVFDPNFEMQVRYHSGDPVFTQRFEVKKGAQGPLSGEVEFMVCNDKTCLPPEVVKFSVVMPAEAEKH